jgi:hypothetical protein
MTDMSEVFRARFDGREWWAMVSKDDPEAVYVTPFGRCSDDPAKASSVSWCHKFLEATTNYV